jgi:hypothetical protein
MNELRGRLRHLRNINCPNLPKTGSREPVFINRERAIEFLIAPWARYCSGSANRGQGRNTGGGTMYRSRRGEKLRKTLEIGNLNPENLDLPL